MAKCLNPVTIDTAAFGGLYGSVREESRESRELPRNCKRSVTRPLFITMVPANVHRAKRVCDPLESGTLPVFETCGALRGKEEVYGEA
jgi:hypothetical protein